MALVELVATGIAAGGDAVARGDDGRVVFVRGALPGERVRVELTEEKPRFARARTVEVLDPAGGRVSPPCPHVARGCGGCTWQHIDAETQRSLKVEIVRDALARIGGVDAPRVEPGPVLVPYGHRTTIRVASLEGAVGFRRHRTHEIVDVDDCLVAHPLLVDLLGTLDPGDATELTLRCGARTGETLIVGPTTPPGAHIHEIVAGARFRVSAHSFFQVRPDGADALVGAVGAAIAGAPDGPLIDAYGGVGLFAATLAGDRAATIVEWSKAAVADARANLPDATVLRLDLARWRPSPAAVVVADPSREGLGAKVVGVLAGTGATHLALVSCDPASLARDAKLLAGQGFAHDGTTLVDLFPHTPHVEAVTRFIREAPRRRR